MATLPGLRVGLTLDSATFVAETRRVDASVNRLGRQVRQQNALSQRSFGALTQSVGLLKQALIGLVAGLTIGAVSQYGRAALDTAGNLGEMSRAAGVTTRELQILTLAGTQAGISQEQLANGLGLFARNVGEAAAGTGEFLEVVNRYNLNLRDSNGTIRSSIDLLGDFADLVQNATSEQEKLSILQDAFGRSGRQFINILDGGAEGLKAFAEQAEAAGLILSEGLIAQADQASDALATLTLAIGTGFQIGVIEQFGRSVSSSTDALRQAREAGEALGQVVGVAMRTAAAAAGFLARNWKELVSVGAALVGLKLGGVIAGIAVAMVQLALAIKSGATAMAIFNSVAGKNVFVILAKGIIAAGIGLATYLALTNEATGATEDLAGELARINTLFDASSIEAVSAATDQVASSLANALEQARRENEQLTALKAAHEGYGASVELVSRAIEIDNALRAAKVTRLEAEESGLLAVLVANQRLRAEIQAGIQAKEDQARAAQQAADEQRRAQEDAARRAQDLIERPFLNALDNVQNTVTSTFETIYSGGVTSFEDLASEVTSIFTKLAAELTTLLIFRPQVAFGGAGGAGSSLASQLGFAGGGVANPAAGGTATGPGGLLVGGGVTSSAGAPAAGGFFGGSALAAGGAGIGVGTIAGGFAGGSQVGSLAGSTIGAIAGGAIGSAIPIIGTAVGAFAGGALGGVIGSFFGGGGDSPGSANNTGRLSFISGGGVGPFGGTTIGGDSDFVRDLGQLVRQFDEGVATFLTQREEDAVAQALQALEEFSGRFSEADPSDAFRQILEQRTRTILETSFPGISADAVLEGASGIEDIAGRLQTALETQRQVTELTQSQTGAARFRRELQAVREQFAELTATAEDFGISTEGLADAQRAAIKTLREQREEEQRLQRQREKARVAQIEQDIQSKLLAVPAAFDALRDPLQALLTTIKFENKNPAQQFEAAQKDFDRLTRQAGRGNLEAISQLPGAAQLLRSLAEQFGASPLQADVDRQIADALRGVISTVNTAQEDAQRGMVTAINQAERAIVDTLRELVAEARDTRREIRRLQRDAARVA